ncbi:MAG: nanoRNase/pAp phosphatase (c-di-AMP/oligoRNAs hydrolase) [Planctomycetota bacterium]|jgi:nanoRNase/pAp phosphatase (c-di-AMP/oligoRNAs hydrolase)
MKTPSLAKLAQSGAARTEVLRDLLRTRQRLLVLTHKNPDPDSLGGAIGLMEFARLACGIETKLAITGKILRAENQAMVRELGIEMDRLDTIKLSDFDCVALVDTQPGFGHTFVPAGTAVDIVIDHHEGDSSLLDPNQTAFVDVRPDIGATSTIVGSYLMHAGVEPSAQAATALHYGIRTDTADLSRNVSELDVQVVDFLAKHLDRQALAAITNPDLPVAYFRTLKDALSKVRIYDGLVLCSLGTTTSAEMVAEVADMLLRMEGTKAVFCGGLVGQSYYISVRTETGGDAWGLIKAGIETEEGSCGGHGSVAGGSITLDCADSRTLRRLERRLERNVLKAMGVSGANAVMLGEDGD